MLKFGPILDIKLSAKFLTSKCNVRLNVSKKMLKFFKSLALNLMWRIEPNTILFILVNVQNRTALIIILVNLLGESLSELSIMVVEIKNPIFFLDML